MSVKPLRDDNPSFTLDAKARDCPPLQFVREFTVNGLEAITARRAAGLPNPGTDQIVWREYSELGQRAPAPKLCCIDTGIGMTADDLDRYIGGLASTSKRQALDDHYGMGAKIAGAVGNPAGLTYVSWTGSREGFTVTLMRNPDNGRWGLAEDPRTVETISVADPALCPVEIRRAGWRGTVAVFHGRGPEHDTTREAAQDLGVDWLEKAINVRFYELPSDVQVRCQRPGEQVSRRALGQAALLAEHTIRQGQVRLSDARVLWRILDENHKRRRKQNSRWAATGHRAALYENELYELRQHKAGGWRKLQEFGILFGHERVVLYVQPDRALPDTVRARLTQVDGDFETKDLPWERWADEFIARMPKALRKLVEATAGKQAARDRRDIMRRLEQIAADMPLPRYVADPQGSLTGGGLTHGGAGQHERASEGGDGRQGTQPGGVHGGNVVTLFTRPEGSAVKRSDTNRIPQIKPIWISEATDDRPPGMLEDRGATFLQRQAVVQLNADFRGYTTLLKYFKQRHGRLAGSEPIIVAEVRGACEDLVIEFIVGALRLRCQPHWTAEAEEHALDDRALTTCLMQHATLAARIDERLARRLRKAA